MSRLCTRAPSPPARRPPWRRAAALVLTAAGVGTACQLSSPGTDVTVGQTVLELGDAVNALRQETGALQEQVDSLRGVVARQDSAIARLAAGAGSGVNFP